MYLLDTDVLSNLLKRAPSAGFLHLLQDGRQGNSGIAPHARAQISAIYGELRQRGDA